MNARHLHLSLFALFSLTLSASCGDEGLEVDNGASFSDDTTEALAVTGINGDKRTVSDMIFQACSTTSVKGLSQQLVEEINCLKPDTMAPMPDHRNLSLGDAVFPYLQKNAADALSRALDGRSSTMYVNSALRALPQQFLLYQWYRNGKRCGIKLAARPGTSNHESGLAVDMSNYSTWRSTMGAYSYRWLGSGDPVHFDYRGQSEDLQSLSVKAFQRLWNRNNPNDKIAEDGSYGPNTEARLKKAPAVGFAKGAACGNTMTPVVELAPIEVYWHRNADNTYNLRALAPSHVESVEYAVEDYVIATASRADGANFPATYTFNYGKRERRFEVRGFDDQGGQVALGVGLIDSVPEYGVYIRQLDKNQFSFGLERAPEDVAYIQVKVDGFDVGSSMGQAQPEVRVHLNELGTRQVEISTYNEDGSLRGTLRRTFTF